MASSTIWATIITFLLVCACLVIYLFLGYFVFTKLPREEDPIVGPLVQTASGHIEGFYVNILGRNVEAFLGIPYAEPPVGDFRFARSEPVRKWRRVHRAKSQPPACLQFTSKYIELPGVGKEHLVQQEDCLRLNVWTPDHTRNKSRPILVWIHGGGFVSGHINAPEFDGSALAAYTDSVVAMMNYRVGVFGFLNLNHPEIEGNMGMHDQVLALKWIKENAESFGGDPEQITLFGESAGGASVGYHLLSPLSRDLFQRAIMMSGTALIPTSLITLDQMHAIGNEVVEYCGCNFTDVRDDIVNCIKSAPMKVLLEVQEKIIRRKDDVTFCPSYFDDFLPEHPIDALRDGLIGHQKEVMIGYNKDEGSVFMYFANPKKYPAIGKNAKPHVNLTMTEVVSFASTFMKSQNPTQTRNLLNTLYSDVNETVPGAIFNATRENVGEFFVVCPSLFMAEELSNNNMSVYFYHFGYRPSNSPWAPWVGTTHYEEVQFIFGIPLIKPHEYSRDEVKLSKKLMRTWGSFARKGIPDHKLGMSWPTYTSRDPEYMDIELKNSEIRTGLPEKRCGFWRLAYEFMHSVIEKPTIVPDVEDFLEK